MSRSNRSSNSTRGASANAANHQVPSPLSWDTTTESLAAAAAAQLSSIEEQLSRFAAGSDDARPYESFESKPLFATLDQPSAAFEYDGHCPLQTPQRSRAATPPAYPHLFAPDGSMTPRENAASTQSIRRSLPDDKRRTVQPAPSIAAEVENAFHKLGRLFGSDAAHQFRIANQRLHEARSLFEEIRRLHAAARDILSEIEQIRAAAGHA